MVYSQLTRNRIVTVALLVAFALFVAWVVMVFSMARTGDPFMFAVPSILFALFYILMSFAFSKNAVLAMSKAKKIDRKDSPELYNLLENLAISCGIKTPGLYIIRDSAPNAFATGTSKKKSAIAVTTGLLDKLDKPELEGVLAHELAHIQHEDTRLMTLVVVMVGIITLISDLFLRSMYFRGGDRESGGKSNAILLITGMALALLSPIIAQLIKLAISRKREFYADAESALTTRYPEGLALALEKISADPEPLEAANRATAHLYISNPLKNRKRSVLSKMFSTHPDTEERVRRLREMMI